MALILNIDTATENASVALCIDGGLLAIRENNSLKEHAAFLHVAISEVLQQSNMDIKELDAIAITSGPGSYTGLRVAMASAKGLCYALNKPLIAINTLYVMAYAAKLHIEQNNIAVQPGQLMAPMIDARRMEVFMAVYNMELNEVEAPHSKIITSEILNGWAGKPIYFLGNGTEKIKSFGKNILSLMNVTSEHLGKISYLYYKDNKFADMVYVQPGYLKEFYSNVHSSDNQ